jgi:polyisoprenoid-binding protein YceI
MRLAFSMIVPLALAMPPAGRADPLEAGPADGHVVVHAYRAGLFSGLAHDHHFAAAEWTATADLPDGDPARTSVAVVIASSSLRDTQKALSEGDRRKVNAQAAGPDVLDAAHHPRIEFRSERVELAPGAGDGGVVRGTLHGTLTARGRTVPLDVPFQAERGGAGWSVKGTARLKQSSLGIKPFSGFGGTVKVKDEVEVEFAFQLGRRER